MIEPDRLLGAYETARGDLLAECEPAGHWIGELSASALSTATAASALAIVAREPPQGGPARDRLLRLVKRGLDWLACRSNADGGWGDTDKSLSNVATTMLVRAAFHLAGMADRHRELLAAAQRYIESQGGLDGLRRRYGKDKTFAVPILTNCALAGLVPWKAVAPLPFELACLPHSVLRFLGLPVVSYALPALVAIGQARYFHRKPLCPLTRLVRRLAIGRSLETLGRMQPASGGFLEATPLTSFVVMSLAGIGRPDHTVVRRGVEFLCRSVRPDGSWPIDTNLATWNTTLSVNALATGGEDVGKLSCLDWLLSCQHTQVHPFTRAAPGGWGWTDLGGAVPDADDTAGALLALAAIAESSSQADARRIRSAAAAGVQWLLGIQNVDGGWPTFCRGWGTLPFDRSGADLTAHALRALHAWRQSARLAAIPLGRFNTAIDRGLGYLARQQRPDGSWVPLWFGNQHQSGEENPVYGTARVLLAYRDLGQTTSEPARRGLAWLVDHQNRDGGWGTRAGIGVGPAAEVSSVEETAVAVEALASGKNAPSLEAAWAKGLDWLDSAVRAGRHREISPIGFYFAKLWYYESLYPLIFTVAALGRAVGLGRDGPEANRPGTTGAASRRGPDEVA